MIPLLVVLNYKMQIDFVSFIPSTLDLVSINLNSLQLLYLSVFKLHCNSCKVFFAETSKFFSLLLFLRT